MRPLLVLALLLVGCSARQAGVAAPTVGGVALPTDAPVKLLTGDVPELVDSSGHRGCYTFAISGELLADPTYGTILKRDDGSTVPIMWSWPGISARRAGSEIEIVVDGKVVATTGRNYNIPGGYHDPGFVACDPLRITPQ